MRLSPAIPCLVFAVCLLAPALGYAQELRLASHGTLGGGPSSSGGIFDVSGGLSLTGCWNPEHHLRVGPWGSLGTNGKSHGYFSGGLMSLWRSDRATSWALLTAAGAIAPAHEDPEWKTGATVRSAVVLWFEDDSTPFSVASPTIGLGIEIRSIPGAHGQNRDNQFIFQLDVDPFAAVVYVPFLIGAAVYGMPH